MASSFTAPPSVNQNTDSTSDNFEMEERQSSGPITGVELEKQLRERLTAKLKGGRHDSLKSAYDAKDAVADSRTTSVKIQNESHNSQYVADKEHNYEESGSNPFREKTVKDKSKKEKKKKDKKHKKHKHSSHDDKGERKRENHDQEDRTGSHPSHKKAKKDKKSKRKKNKNEKNDGSLDKKEEKTKTASEGLKSVESGSTEKRKISRISSGSKKFVEDHHDVKKKVKHDEKVKDTDGSMLSKIEIGNPFLEKQVDNFAQPVGEPECQRRVICRKKGSGSSQKTRVITSLDSNVLGDEQLTLPKKLDKGEETITAFSTANSRDVEADTKKRNDSLTNIDANVGKGRNALDDCVNSEDKLTLPKPKFFEPDKSRWCYFQSEEEPEDNNQKTYKTDFCEIIIPHKPDLKRKDEKSENIQRGRKDGFNFDVKSLKHLKREADYNSQINHEKITSTKSLELASSLKKNKWSKKDWDSEYSGKRISGDRGINRIENDRKRKHSGREGRYPSERTNEIIGAEKIKEFSKERMPLTKDPIDMWEDSAGSNMTSVSEHLRRISSRAKSNIKIKIGCHEDLKSAEVGGQTRIAFNNYISGSEQDIHSKLDPKIRKFTGMEDNAKRSNEKKSRWDQPKADDGEPSLPDISADVRLTMRHCDVTEEKPQNHSYENYKNDDPFAEIDKFDYDATKMDGSKHDNQSYGEEKSKGSSTAREIQSKIKREASDRREKYRRTVDNGKHDKVNRTKREDGKADRLDRREKTERHYDQHNQFTNSEDLGRRRYEKEKTISSKLDNSSTSKSFDKNEDQPTVACRIDNDDASRNLEKHSSTALADIKVTPAHIVIEGCKDEDAADKTVSHDAVTQAIIDDLEEYVLESTVPKGDPRQDVEVEKPSRGGLKSRFNISITASSLQRITGHQGSGAGLNIINRNSATPAAQNVIGSFPKLGTGGRTTETTGSEENEAALIISPSHLQDPVQSAKEEKDERRDQSMNTDDKKEGGKRKPERSRGKGDERKDKRANERDQRRGREDVKRKRRPMSREVSRNYRRLKLKKKSANRSSVRNRKSHRRRGRRSRSSSSSSSSFSSSSSSSSGHRRRGTDRRRRSRSRGRSRGKRRPRETTKRSSPPDKRRPAEVRLGIDRKKLRRIAILNMLRTIRPGLTNVSALSVDELKRFQAGGVEKDELEEICKELTAKQERLRAKGAADHVIEAAMLTDEEEVEECRAKAKLDNVERAGRDRSEKSKTRDRLAFNISETVKVVPTISSSEPLIKREQLLEMFPVSSGIRHQADDDIQVPSASQQPLPSKPEIPEIIAPTVSPQKTGANTNLGEFTGKVELVPLSQKELQAGIQPWLKKNQFVSAAPVTNSIGQELLKRMGWREGEGLGKNRDGLRQPVLLDIKVDRKGLSSLGETMSKKPQPLIPASQGTNLATVISSENSVTGMTDSSAARVDKHPVSVLLENSNKWRWNSPTYQVVSESGPSHSRNFLMSVTINGQVFMPSAPSRSKKEAKLAAASSAVKQLGLE